MIMCTEPLSKLKARILDKGGNTAIIEKYLTDEIMRAYGDKKTKFGGTLAQCVRNIADNPEYILPHACDPDAYDTFEDFFVPLTEDYYQLRINEIVHLEPESDYGKILKLRDLNPGGDRILFTRLEVRRNIDGYAFDRTLTKDTLLVLENKITDAVMKLTGECQGTYRQLDQLDEEHIELVKKHNLFGGSESEIFEDSNASSGRGLFINDARNMLICVNEDDHIRLISVQENGDLNVVYGRLMSAIEELSTSLKFAHSNRLGYMTVCPSNLGNAITASIFVRVPLLALLPNFERICEMNNIRISKTRMVYNFPVRDVYELKNRPTLGLTGMCALVEMQNGLQSLLDLEDQMVSYNGDSPVGLMPVEPLSYLRKLLEAADVQKCYVKKHLTDAVVQTYDGVRTTRGATLAHMIRHCAYNLHDTCPRTGEAECYTKFSDYLHPVICDYHSITDVDFKHPPIDFGNLESLPFGNVDPQDEFVISTRIRVGRSVEGFPFCTIMSKPDRLKLEAKVSAVLGNLTGQHAGLYYPLSNMREDERKTLVDDHYLFRNDEPVFRDTGGYRDWPAGRGIFHNPDKTFLVWIGEEDHVRIISMQKGGDLVAVYKRLVEGLRLIENELEFSCSDKYGFLTCCPSNLGTTMRASVLIKIPKLSREEGQLEQVCEMYGLQARGLYGEYTDSPEGIHDISNKRRVGLTEVLAAQEMAKGVLEIIKIEKSLF